MTTDLRARLAAADPARTATFDDDELTRRARAVLAEADEVVATSGVHGPVLVRPEQPPRRAPRRRRVAGALAVAAVLAAGVAVVPSLLGGATREHRQAAALLQQAADAITATDPPVRADQYWKVTSTGFALGTSLGPDDRVSAALVTQSNVSYIAADGSRPTYVASAASRVLRQLVGSPDPGDGPIAAEPGVTVFPAPDREPPTWGAPTAAFLRSLPRDPGALLARIRRDSVGAGSSPDGEVVVTVADVLRSGLVPADLRAALYRALAAVPGVVISAADATVDGADGVAFAYEEAVNGIRQEIIVDPSTGVVVGEREVATRAFDDGVPAGTVISQSTVSRELVDAVPAEVVAAAR